MNPVIIQCFQLPTYERKYIADSSKNQQLLFLAKKEKCFILADRLPVRKPFLRIIARMGALQNDDSL